MLFAIYVKKDERISTAGYFKLLSIDKLYIAQKNPEIAPKTEKKTGVLKRKNTNSTKHKAIFDDERDIYQKLSNTIEINTGISNDFSTPENGKFRFGSNEFQSVSRGKNKEVFLKKSFENFKREKSNENTAKCQEKLKEKFNDKIREKSNEKPREKFNDKIRGKSNEKAFFSVSPNKNIPKPSEMVFFDRNTTILFNKGEKTFQNHSS